MDRHVKTYSLLLSLLTAVSCSVIDEDLSDCVEQAKMDYELRLVTNMTTELKTQLTTQTDLNIAQALRTQLSDVFTDFAHDVDLSFYDTQGDSARLQHDEHIMDANQASYALNLPMRQYMHLATANIIDNELVTLEDDDNCHRARLQQVARDTIDSHGTGVFTARQPMEVLEGIDQNFNVHLYMANCAATLVIDPRGHGDLDKIRVYSTGFATGFNICDSTYLFDGRSPVVRTMRSESDNGNELAFTSVTFPSRDPEAAGTRAIIETEEPFVAQPGEPLWEIQVYVPQSDGSITRSVLSVKTPLRAGQFKIIKCWIGDEGDINVPNNPDNPDKTRTILIIQIILITRIIPTTPITRTILIILITRTIPIILITRTIPIILTIRTILITRIIPIIPIILTIRILVLAPALALVLAQNLNLSLTPSIVM